jgi:nucleoside-diphosphate-sugar epimerase
MAMRVLITGAGGFIGSHLVDSQLAQGHQVRAADLNLERLAHARGNPRLEEAHGDISEAGFLAELVQDVDVVYHLASAHLDVSQGNDTYHRVNVTATRQLLVAAQAAGVQHFVHCSSNGVLGEIETLPADETTPCHPTNIYEQTKLLGEQAALAFAAKSGFSVVVARPAWVYGPRCPRTARLLRMVGRGRFLMFGNGRTLRHPIYVADAVRGLEQCATAGTPGEIYFLAGEKAVTLNELVKTMAEAMQVKLRVIRLPLALGIVAGHVVQAAFQPLRLHPPISRRTIDFFIKDNAYRTEKAQRDLGFRAQADLRAGILKTLAVAEAFSPPAQAGLPTISGR